MATTKDQIRQWFYEADEAGAFALFICMDEFDYTCYPVSVKNLEEFRTEYERLRLAPMNRVREIYDLNSPPEPQLDSRLAWFMPI